MSLVSLAVEIHCVRPTNTGPVYRVYVDHDLLTERTWIWPAYNVYIDEHIEIDVEPGTHNVRIENCTPNSELASRNLRVNGEGVQDLTFTV